MWQIDEDIQRLSYYNFNVIYDFISFSNLYFKTSSKKRISDIAFFETGCIFT